jgi:hypothetical protein
MAHSGPPAMREGCFACCESVDWGVYSEAQPDITYKHCKDASMLKMTSEWTELIQLYMALIEHFDIDELHYICPILGVDWENLAGTDKSDKSRELILSLWRRRRIGKLIEVCYQLRTDFHWKDRDVHFEITDALIRIRKERLLEIFANHLTLSELQQLCFYFDIEFEDISPVGLLHLGGENFSEGQRRSLRNLGINYDVLTSEEITVRLKRLWATNFMSYLERRGGNTAQVAAVCRYIRPSVF